MLKRFLLFYLLSSAAVVCAGVHSTGAMIISDGNRVIIRGKSGGIEEMMKKRKELGERFFYFEEDGERYLVRDASVVSRLFSIYESAHAAKAAEKDVRRRQRLLAQRERRIDREIDKIEEALDDEEADQRALEARQQQLEQEIEQLEREAARLEEEHERLQVQRELQEERATDRVVALKKQLIRSGAAVKVRE